MKLPHLLAAALLAVAPATANAITVGFTYAGVSDDNQYITAAGTGTISFNGTGPLTLANVTGFSFSQTTTLADPTLPGAGTFSYGFADLLTFAGVFNGANFSALGLRTRTVADPSGFLADQSFRIRSLGEDGASAAFDDGDEATAGTVRITAAVPEPSSWALTIIGVGLAGAAARGRRRAPVHASFA